ncbi:NAD-dependent epimerase/dehydratase family protein [Altererythrobacter aurantiacus]|uniref:GDP-L-fucose synthase n=1 Tax=Parapontixanthobacter aurantiacus TaxID=1463599 RepID=A0A844ZFZ0_9SPHN|nr:GDP-L-fucose synthase [Parapontixanthobacter aurantiacus]MXO86765.1 NAD-dependent epimerase/dehydratase family protein [Parapontixanthobacter aurantiacus]
MPEQYDLSGKRIYVAGHRGMVGSALLRRLESEDCEVLTSPRSLDLRAQDAVFRWFEENRPDAAIIAAAKVGGILANSTYPAQFLYDNLTIAANTVEAAHRTKTGKLLFLGSSCIYPREAPQPMSEEVLLTGPLEPTNEPYAIAKIAGVKLCEAYRREYGSDFISAMPTNLYGPGDNYDLQNSHVLPALIRKAHEAKRDEAERLVVWGSGTPLREFLHVDDLADACVFLLRHYSGERHVNVGSGQEIAIVELARLVAEVVGFGGAIVCDSNKPDGTPRKLLDTSMINGLGWLATISLREGIASAYSDFLAKFDG